MDNGPRHAAAPAAAPLASTGVRAALFQLFPQLVGQIPWVPLGQWPTPLAPLPNLGKRLGADVWIKHDDVSGPILGGNKVRKLEFLLAAAQRRRCHSIVTVGGIGSNHVVSTAIYGQQLGMKTHALVFPQPMTPRVEETLTLIQALAVQLSYCPRRLLLPFYLPRAWGAAEHPFWLGPGGSSPLGTLGYVSAALELRLQLEQQDLLAPHDIIVPLGSGGTAAGLVVGLAIAGLPCRVIAVRVVERLLSNRSLVQLLAWRTARYLKKLTILGGERESQRPSQPPNAHDMWAFNTPQLDRIPSASHVWVQHDFFGGRYGRPTAAALAAVQHAADEEGLVLETTYSGKAFAALLAYAQGPGKGRRLLFWNTHNSRALPSQFGRNPPHPLPDALLRWIQQHPVLPLAAPSPDSR